MEQKVFVVVKCAMGKDYHRIEGVFSSSEAACDFVEQQIQAELMHWDDARWLGLADEMSVTRVKCNNPAQTFTLRFDNGKGNILFVNWDIYEREVG